MNAFLALVLLAAPAGASPMAGGGGGGTAFAVAQGAAAYAVVSDPTAVSGRVIVRRLGLDGDSPWQDRWGEGRSEEPVAAAVGAGGELTVVGDGAGGCWAARWSPGGRLLWSATLRYGSGCAARAALADGSGGVYVLATTTVGTGLAPTLWRLDARGATLWNDRPSDARSVYAYGLTLDAAGDGVTVLAATSAPSGWTYSSYRVDAAGRRR
jgi:hypothetical protein